MFDNIIKFFKNLGKKEKTKESSDTAKERLHLVLMQDRANVSADFLELMKQEIIEVIKKYIDIDEKAIDVRLTNKTNDDGTVGAPALYANIPIVTIKNEARVANVPHEKKDDAEIKNDSEPEEIEQSEKVIEDAKKIQSEAEKETKPEEIEESKKDDVKENEEEEKEEEEKDSKENKEEKGETKVEQTEAKVKQGETKVEQTETKKQPETDVEQGEVKEDKPEEGEKNVEKKEEVSKK